MAYNYNGGTDGHRYAGSWPSAGAIAFRFKTTQATANVMIVSQWSGGSRNGWGFILNNTAGTLRAQCYGTSAGNIGFEWPSTATINDGAWHSIVLNFNTANGQSNEYFVDGVTEHQANSAVTWTNNISNPVAIGDNNDTFWPSYVGDFADPAMWNAQLSADEVAAYGKGFSPLLIKPASLVWHPPLIRDIPDLRGFATVSTLGAPTQSEHPRVFQAE